MAADVLQKSHSQNIFNTNEMTVWLYIQNINPHLMSFTAS